MTAGEQKIPNVARFCIGGAAGMAAVCFTHPLGLIKIRMQKSGELGVARQYKTSFHAVYLALRNEGFFALYNGLSAALLRQAIYQSTRLGTYTSLLEYVSKKQGGQTSYATKAGLGTIAGATGGFVGVPADLAMVRMTLDGRLPPERRRNYKNVLHALYRITKEEGATTLWRGSGGTLLRSLLSGTITLATYSQTKQALLDTGYFADNVIMYLTASFITGFPAAIACVPADMAKTRIQDVSMKDTAGAQVYKNTFDVWVKTVKYEGVKSLWKGFGPYYVRMAPQQALLFVFLENFTQMYAKYVLKIDNFGKVHLL